MKNLNLFPIPISVFNLKMSSDEKKYLNEIDYKTTNSDYLDAENSTDVFLLEKEELKELKEKIIECINKYKKIMLSCNLDIYITNSWANRLKQGKKHSLHMHQNSFISGVYYVESNINHPGIRFENPSKTFPLTWNREKFNLYNSESYVYPAETETLILFPSGLWHSVDVNYFFKDRISISFNTFVKGKLGHEGYLCDLNL